MLLFDTLSTFVSTLYTIIKSINLAVNAKGFYLLHYSIAVRTLLPLLLEIWVLKYRHIFT